MCSYKLITRLGRTSLRQPRISGGILKSAFEQGVPVFVPAFTDSELGWMLRSQSAARVDGAAQDPVRSILDLEHFAAYFAAAEAPREFSPSGARFAELVSAVRTVHRAAHRRLGENVP